VSVSFSAMDASGCTASVLRKFVGIGSAPQRQRQTWILDVVG
jgi:hypothetical protein